MFNFSFDRRAIYILIAIIILSSIVNYMNNPESFFWLIVSIPGVLIAITFHEFAHGYAAYKLGDDTAKQEGRLSLNPFKHLDLVGIVMLLFAGFGWGKPVNVNPRNYTREISMEKGEAIVSVAGPLMNIFLAIIFAIIYALIYKYVDSSFYISTMGRILMMLISSIISINIGLGIFNLIPLPPLDGSKIIIPFLPYNAKEWFRSNELIFYYIFVLIWITGLASYIISPAINIVTSGVMKLATMIVGL